MAILAVISSKGGVGKTTSAITLAACLAAEQQLATDSPVALWDLDPGGDATLRLDLERGVDVMSMLLAGRANPSENLNSYGLAQAAQLSRGGLNVVPAPLDLSDIESRYESIADGIELTAFRLRELCRGQTVVIDTAPGLKAVLSRAVIAVADMLIVPVIPEPRAERHVLDVLAALRGLDSRAELVIVATMVGADSGGLPEFRAALEAERLKISAIIPREAAVNDAIWSAATILEAAPKSRAAHAYRALARHMLRGSLGALVNHDAPLKQSIRKG